MTSNNEDFVDKSFLAYHEKPINKISIIRLLQE